MKQDKEHQILQAAEEMVRQGGYNSFSFRNIASAVGIKSSSVHYHFATKEALGVAVTKFYTDKFLDALGNPQELLEKGIDPVGKYVEAFRAELEDNKGMCMCGMLGAEAASLPENVVKEIRTFFKRNQNWLQEAYTSKGFKDKEASAKALQAMALLEGAMIISNTLSDLKIFDISTQALLD